ncbi:DeoR/GlpR transcriptional regulator [Paracoccus aurantiacus]|uniref:DeoR/GlpR transcriptional regulator n=1 Tax=Paracoccus aurantiacus TaxID=2599412 RepID=A0A5C6S6S4_9RHOB|nr:DeoR/GlpR family DNA-binding transcription regulator [Paracoccus aurantiacus]TXB69334.1 DeoR/GlpR transcriptional regulator [Paracoccus aurantiacus]
MLDLNCPQTRQTLISERLDNNRPLIASELAAEFDISLDTLRRDLIALEQRGVLQRIRGGAIPASPPLPPYATRALRPEPGLDALAEAVAPMLAGLGTVILDGGTTMNVVAARLPEGFDGLVVTPAPSVALAALQRGARVHLIGGALCPDGAIATGGEAERAISQIAADICLLGACGLWPGFGLSAEDSAEAGVKRAMAGASRRVAVVALQSKLARRGRHRILGAEEIDLLVTDASPEETGPFRDAGTEVHHV